MFCATVNYVDRSGQLSSIWDWRRVATVEAVWPIVRESVEKARRVRGTAIRFDVFDDLAGRSVLRGRVK